jgi:hypothetical protein
MSCKYHDWPPDGPCRRCGAAFREGWHKRPDIATRFWQKVDQSGDCWEWRGVILHGYGLFTVNGRPVRAHRMAYELTHEPIPVGLHVLHDCDNKRCVRPDHLHLGTHAQNMAEAAARGRMNQGRISGADVARIRMLRASGLPVVSIAERFGISAPYVSNIVAGRKRRNAA